MWPRESRKVRDRHGMGKGCLQNKPKGLKVAKEELRSIGSLLICIMAEGGEGVMVADRHNGI